MIDLMCVESTLLMDPKTATSESLFVRTKTLINLLKAKTISNHFLSSKIFSFEIVQLL